MDDQILRLTNEFLARESTHLYKSIINLSDNTLSIRHRNDLSVGVARKLVLKICYRAIIFHLSNSQQRKKYEISGLNTRVHI